MLIIILINTNTNIHQNTTTTPTTTKRMKKSCTRIAFPNLYITQSKTRANRLIKEMVNFKEIRYTWVREGENLCILRVWVCGLHLCVRVSCLYVSRLRVCPLMDLRLSFSCSVFRSACFDARYTRKHSDIAGLRCAGSATFPRLAP